MQLIGFTRDGHIRSGGIEGVADPSMTRALDLNAADPRLPADMLQLLRGGDELLDLAGSAPRPSPWPAPSAPDPGPAATPPVRQQRI
jgi:hypothetical protein